MAQDYPAFAHAVRPRHATSANSVGKIARQRFRKR
jgi:hypothetical protein